MLGLNRTSASSGSLLLNLEGLATTAVAWLVFRENADRRLLLGAFAIVAGAVTLSSNGQGVSFDAGAGLIAAACVAWGIDNNLTRKLSSADPVLTTMIKGLVAGGVNLSLALLSGSLLPPVATLGAAGLVGFVGVGVSLVLFVLALRHLGAARTGALFLVSPVHRRHLVARPAQRAPDASIAARGGLMIFVFGCTLPNGTSMNMSTKPWSMNTATFTTRIISTITMFR